MSYTYSRTFLRQNDKRIEKPVNNGDWYPTEYDKPHDFKFVGNYNLRIDTVCQSTWIIAQDAPLPYLPDSIMMNQRNRCEFTIRKETHTAYRITFVQTSLLI